MSSATRRTSCTAIWRKSRGPVTHDRLAFCFGIHNHQPIGNFDHVLVEATERAYHPFLERLHARPEVRLVVHCTGSLLEWLRERAPRTFDLLAALAGGGQVELLTGGFYEPILAVLPDHDKFGQIERLTAFLKTHLGIRPRGMWLAERVWEPHLPRVLAEAGVEYVLVDDSHFALAGLDPDTLGGYYLTEDQGVRLRVFPISQRLRYLIPFAGVEASLEYLAARRGRVPAVTMVDDGEKFGVWPGTHAHVYEKGWLDRFFDRLLATEWLDLVTLSDIVDRVEATDRVYLPTASYREMGEWVLPPAARRRLERAKDALERLGGDAEHAELLRGGFWRNFLARYPEVADTYWKMLRLSGAVRGALARAPHDSRLREAQIALWRGQANDAYWHGVFGGCYLPHLRRAVKSALLECERCLAESGAAHTRVDARGRQRRRSGGGLREDAGPHADVQPGAGWRAHRARLPRARPRRGRRAGAPPGGVSRPGSRAGSAERRGGGEDHSRRARAEGSGARGAAHLRRGPPRLASGRLVRRRHDAARPRVALGAGAPRARGRTAHLHGERDGWSHCRHVHPRRRGPGERREGGDHPRCDRRGALPARHAGRHAPGGALGGPVEPRAHGGGRPRPVPDRDRPALARQHGSRAGPGGRGAGG